MRGQKTGKKTFSYFDQMEHPTGNCRKDQYDNIKGCQKFERATYTKEMNIIK